MTGSLFDERDHSRKYERASTNTLQKRAAFRGGLVIKGHRLLRHSVLGLRRSESTRGQLPCFHDEPCLTHTVAYDPIIKSQLAPRDRLEGSMRCKFGHVPHGFPRGRNPRTPSSGQTELGTARQLSTGAPHLHENAPHQDPTVGLCLGS